MKDQEVTIKERFKEEYQRQMTHQPKEETEPLTDEAWFMIIFLLSMGTVFGFILGVFLV
jgi:heme/copper-type cytochrome/quinol oxidase subunit 3